MRPWEPALGKTVLSTTRLSAAIGRRVRPAPNTPKPRRQTGPEIIHPSCLERRNVGGRLTASMIIPVLKKISFLLGGHPVAPVPGILCRARPCTASQWEMRITLYRHQHRCHLPSLKLHGFSVMGASQCVPWRGESREPTSRCYAVSASTYAGPSGD